MRPPHDNTLSQPSRPLAITLADIVERFKSAWRQAPPAPDLAAFLPPEGELRRRGLEDLVLIDLEHRLKAGQAARVEDYLRRYHELADGGAALSELIAAEHRLRLGREPGLDAAEYLARFPQCREAILARLGPTAQPPGTQRTALPADSRTLDLPQTDTVDTAPAALPLPARRYLLGEEIGHGGMGEVHRARDPHLGRELAVKVLRGDRHTNPESLRRFVEEAQVCGQLQHPAIVPVHDLGRLEDERPFFAMKLVKGRTLADLLKDRAGPADGLPRFLTIFEQICQALAYAHARGVIHRDLKPANVMVGAFGEVQVMDWGLAKVLRPQASAPTVVETAATIIRTVRSAGLDESRDGQAVGTPAYMAPEQARGEVELLDERCDVFGLGAILCEVLTGKPPFIGSTPNEIHARAMCADLGGAFARLDGCGADAELVGLAKACLAADAAARPRDAGAVTATVTAYQHAVQERLREAELGRARAQVRAVEERKRRRLTVGLALAMLTLVVSLAAVGLWLQRQRAERREEAARQQAERQAEAARQEGALRQDMEARLAQAASLRRGGHFEEGLKLLGQARQRLGADGPDDLREQVDRASSDTALARRLDEARQRASTLTEERRLDYAGAAKEYGAALRGAGLGREGEDAAAVAARVRASAVRVEIVAALDEWVGLTSGRARREWLLAVARLADPDPLRDRLRQPERWRDKTALARLAKEASAQELPPQLAAALARALLRSGGDAVPLLRATQARYPDDFWLNFLLGGALLGGKERDEAIGFYRAALALRPRAAVIHNNLGVALGRTGKQDEAIRHYERAVALAPNNALAHNNLGIVLRSKGKLEEAIRHFEEALRIDPKFADAHVTLGSALRARKPEEAIRHFEEALRIDPKNANAHVNLGLALYGKGKQEEAIRHYERALQSDPKNANAHHYLGNALYDQGKQEEAIRHFEEALRIDPKLANARYKLSVALEQRNLDEAVRHYEEALRLDPKNAAAQVNLGDALSKQRKRDQAISHFEQALRLDPKNAAAHNSLGMALGAKGKPDEAIRHYEEALCLDPKNANAHVNLGNALRTRGKPEEVIRHYEEALRLDPKLAQTHYGLGQVLLSLGRLAEAQGALRRGHALVPERDPLHGLITRQLQRCERLLALEARLPAVLAGKEKPADAAEWLELAGLCQTTKRYATAARFYADAFAADPKLADRRFPDHRYNAARYAVLAAAGQGADGPKPDDKERALLRRQALNWLRAHLALRQKQAESAKAADRTAAQRSLRSWQKEANLASVREQQALATLPAEERAEWEKLWSDVAALLRRLDAGKPGAAPAGK